ncbi:hypothetical protein GIB67_016237, partial [Kingdonia uniflora]
YWFNEYCGAGHPIVKEALKITSYPRLKAWEKGQPWGTSMALQLDDIHSASYLSRKRISLQVPNGNCEYYLGDKCWRQLTGTAVIPLDPPLNMSSYLSPSDLQNLYMRRGREVRVVPLPPGGGASMRQGTREHGLRTRGVDNSRRGRGTRDNIGLSQ